MPKEYGIKEKDKVIEHLIGKLLSGDLASGDRIDRNVLATELGMSRIPVQEAIVQLEGDGLLSSMYHRGVFVERFDADLLREHFELYGELSGLVSSRAAADPTPELLADLHELLDSMEKEGAPAEIEELGWLFRRAINRRYAGARLRAAIRSSQTVIPKLFWVAESANGAIMVQSYNDETEAIEQRDPERARKLCTERSALMAEAAVRALERRGVLDPLDNEFSEQGADVLRDWASTP